MYKKVQVTFNGKSYNMPLCQSSCGPFAVDIECLYKKLGVYAYDFGFSSTASCRSSLTYVDGEKGVLRYCGYNILDLVKKNSFLDVCYLLLQGDLPGNFEVNKLESDIANEYSHYSSVSSTMNNINKDIHPMAMLGSAFFLSTANYNINENNYSNSSLYSDLAAFMLAHISMMVAMIYRKLMNLDFIKPNPKLNYLDNFIHMMFSNIGDNFFTSSDIRKAIEILMILHADHGQNASTSTIRMVASTYAHPVACFSAGIAALWGKAHGGANEHVIKMLKSINSIENVDSFIKKVENHENGIKLMGFGHRIYKNFDPRAKIIKKECYKILKLMNNGEHNNLFKIAKKLEERALDSEYFISRNLYPNVDFYSGILLNALKIPSSMFTCIFVLSRMIGWVSQLKELMMDPELKIYRPRQLYIGEVDRDILIHNKKAS